MIKEQALCHYQYQHLSLCNAIESGGSVKHVTFHLLARILHCSQLFQVSYESYLLVSKERNGRDPADHTF